MKKTTLLLLTLLACALGARAQGATATLDVANFRAPIRSDGQLFQNSNYSLSGLEWPKAAIPANSRYISYTGQLWMSGYDSLGTLRLAANTYGQSGRGYYPGRSGFDYIQYDQVWKINKSEVDQFRSDFASSTVNFANYPIIQTWPAFVTDLQGTVKPYAPFVDVDGNPAAYDPMAGDYPDMPGDQAIFFGFTDDPTINTPYFPNYLGLDILGFIYAYDCPQLKDVFFVRYDVQNWSPRDIHDLRVGLWHDSDLGNAFDDAIGSDTTSPNPMMYCYNADANDETSMGYGLNPPAIGYTLLSEPATSGIYYQNDFTSLGNPGTPTDYAGYLDATWKDGSHMTYGGNGHNSSATNSDFAFTGDAGFCGGSSSGWTQTPGAQSDLRCILSAAPTDLAIGQSNRYTYAILVARAFQNDNLGSVCTLLQFQDSLVHWMANGMIPQCDIASETEAPKPGLNVTLAPNPTQASAVVRFENTHGETASLDILDLQGRTVLPSMTASESTFTIQTDGLAQGLYLLRLRCGDQQTVLRLQKN